METHEILLALGAPGDPHILGNIWRITAKKADFYLDLAGDKSFHLSMHGPREQFKDHRFHVRVDRDAVLNSKREGNFVAHRLPRKGLAFDGEQVSEKAFRVARLRWTWHLQRPKYRSAAYSGQIAEEKELQERLQMSDELHANSAWDVDLVVSYDKPFWPSSVQGDPSPRVGPLKTNTGLWLTATSYHRRQSDYPTPDNIALPTPTKTQTPNRITACGLDAQNAGGMYWFTQTITSRELIEAYEGRRMEPTNEETPLPPTPSL